MLFVRHCSGNLFFDVFSRFWFLLVQVGEKLNGIDPYFTKLSEAMVTWIDAWTEISAAHKKEAAAANGAVKPASK